MRATPLVAVVTAAALLTTAACDPFAGSKKPTVDGTASQSGSQVDYGVWAAGRSTPVADPIYPKRGTADLDVLHYNLDLSWAPTNKVLGGTATLRIRPVHDGRSIVLDFASFTLDEVKVDGAPAPARVGGEKLTVDHPVTADHPVTLTVRYHGTPAQVPAPTERPDMTGLGMAVVAGGLWTMQEPYGAFTWYPANDQPSDKALYDIAVSVPAGWAAVASGTPVEEPAAGASSQPTGPSSQPGTAFRYHSADPVAAYLVTLAVGHYHLDKRTGPHGLPIYLWYRDSDAKALPQMRKSGQYIEWLEQHYGPYPFPTAGVVLVDSLSGMETQQMVTMGIARFEFKDAEAWGYDLFHEYSHHWFGDTLTPTNWIDMWLNEGWATYSQLLFETEHGYERASDLDTLLSEYDQSFRRTYGPPGKPKPELYGEGNVYFCGAAMLHQIRRAVGDTEFFAMARDWIQTHRNSNQDRAAFIAFVNKHTGRDFTKLINSWLDSPTTPKV